MNASRTARVVGLAVVVFACSRITSASSPHPEPEAPSLLEERSPPQPAGSNAKDAATRAFLDRMREYVEFHNRVEKMVPGLKETSDPAQLSKRQAALAAAMIKQRPDAKEGDFFIKEYQPFLRQIVTADFKNRASVDRKALIVELPKGVSIGVNMVYPTVLPLATFPGKLLKELPELPRELEYRIVGRSLLLRDVEANVIVDLLRDVFPNSNVVIEAIMARNSRLSHFGAIVGVVAASVVLSQTVHPLADGRALSAVTASASAQSKPAPAANATTAPVAEQSLRFAVLGDTGTGERAQFDVAAQLWKSHAVFPYEFVIMVGDNMYGSERPQDFARKFELPYKPLIDARIPFYASLGNHDDPNQRFYKPFNMNGERFYSFKKDKFGNPGVRFFALDSNYMSRDQLEWLDKELAGSGSDWKIPFFHHPLYSSGGRHGSEVDLRDQLEPLFLKHGVNVVFAGHEHFYERLKPQKGIHYFTAGGSAKLRSGDIQRSAMTEVGFDTDNSYMLIEVAGDVMHFQTLSRVGRRVDSGSFTRSNRPPTQQ